jgi:hypothetical protein
MNFNLPKINSFENTSTTIINKDRKKNTLIDNIFDSSIEPLNKKNNNHKIISDPLIIDTDLFNTYSFNDYKFSPNKQFINRKDIMSDSIDLALLTLNMSKNEYNLLTKDELLKYFSNLSKKEILAYNILIYYKL